MLKSYLKLRKATTQYRYNWNTKVYFLLNHYPLFTFTLCLFRGTVVRLNDVKSCNAVHTLFQTFQYVAY